MKQWNNIKLTQDLNDKLMLLDFKEFNSFSLILLSMIATHYRTLKLKKKQKFSEIVEQVDSPNICVKIICYFFIIQKKPIHLPDKQASKAEGQKNDQPQSCEIEAEYFEQFSTLPVGLNKYISNDLIGTPLDDIDPFYKDKQVIKIRSIGSNYWIRVC